VDLTNFDYPGDSRCPLRRPHPAQQSARRPDRATGRQQQPASGPARPALRPAYDPAKPDSIERGLLGNFIGANLGAQFEATMCDWLNLGLQDPRVTGSNDALTGANDPATSWFDIPPQVRRHDPVAGLAAVRLDPRRRLYIPAEHPGDQISGVAVQLKRSAGRQPGPVRNFFFGFFPNGFAADPLS